MGAEGYIKKSDAETVTANLGPVSSTTLGTVSFINKSCSLHVTERYYQLCFL